MLHRVQVAGAGLHGRIAAKKPLLRKSKKKRIAWAKKHKEWMLDQWKSLLWSVLHPNFRFMVCLFATQKKMSGWFSHVVPKVEDGERGVMVWWCFTGETICDFIPNWRHTEPAWLPQHSAATCHPIWFVHSGTIICFSTWKVTPNTSQGCVRAIWPKRKLRECCHSHPT